MFTTTVTLDDDLPLRMRRECERLGISQRQYMREAIRDRSVRDEREAIRIEYADELAELRARVERLERLIVARRPFR